MTQATDADREFELWFFRDISDAQRRTLISLMLGPGCGEEATNHGLQRTCLRAMRARHREQAVAERDARIAEKWLEPVMATKHENDTYQAIATAIRNQEPTDGR